MSSDFSAVLLYIHVSKMEGHYWYSYSLSYMALSNTPSSSMHSMATAVLVALLVASALVSSTYAGMTNLYYIVIFKRIYMYIH